MTGRRIATYGGQTAVLEPFPAPADLGAHELLLEIHYSLISPGTELGGYNAPKRDTPAYPGYTAVGRILRVGAGADSSLENQTVYVFPAKDDCRHCHATHKVVKPGGLVLPVPEGLDEATVCFVRMINIALTPYRNAEPKTTGTVLVLGLGLVGNMVGQVGRIRGFQVIGADPEETRRRRAAQSGFHHVVDPAAGDLVTAVRDLTGGRGAELTVNATGRTEVYLPALAATADGGELSTLGGAKNDVTGDLRDVFHAVQTRHVTIRGGWEMLLPLTTSPAARGASTEANLRDAFRYLLTGAVNLAPVWTHTISPDQFKSAYDALSRRDPDYLGVVIDWT